MRYGKELKALALADDAAIYSEYMVATRAEWRGIYSVLEAFEAKYGFPLFMACGLIKRSRRLKRKRCTEKVADFVESGKAWFITLTFSNEALERTTEETRRRNVCRQLKKVSTRYVANIDYGDRKKNPDSNEREHYHGIVFSEGKPDLSWWTENMGFVKVKAIRPTEKDAKKVAAYTAKLSHHALKKSTERDGKCPRIIYSRNTR